MKALSHAKFYYIVIIINVGDKICFPFIPTKMGQPKANIIQANNEFHIYGNLIPPMYWLSHAKFFTPQNSCKKNC